MPPTVSKRFELPKLDFKFGSLTDGTNIPPPLPSPVQEVPTPPQTPRVSETKDSGSAVKEKVESKTNGHTAGVPGSPATTNGTKGFSDDTPLSPAASSRQGSIRRLFSRTLLNQAYAEGETQSNAHNRPMSRSQGSIIDEKKSKRSSGWFKRLRTSESSPPQKRSSIVYEHPNVSETSSQLQSKPQIPQPRAPQVQGPPPPMIPELSALQARLDVGDGGSLGDDLFKNIK
ncbi:hypothetical protein CORC01_08271 [Colletotrichum orchidophilum]|uniref:Uncharacterized protein n=1 Tax=Colletotrichum orchidophilum TaxID=1209926 RepID=A0A1G4B4Z2_9PEZI|nr:uncharacterized protein CORC01_08271 [Colletotrichum orchidophilum]OHE96508.1 hypothetical protein CORC01_08271 [Colletotrichum orchidophilum]